MRRIIRVSAWAVVLGSCVAGCSSGPDYLAMVDEFITVVNDSSHAMGRTTGPDPVGDAILQIRKDTERLQEIEQRVDALTPDERKELRIMFKRRQGAMLGAHVGLIVSLNSASERVRVKGGTPSESMREGMVQLLHAETAVFAKIAGRPPEGPVPSVRGAQGPRIDLAPSGRSQATPPDLGKKGLMAMHARDYDGAIGFFNEAIRTSPQNARPYAQRGSAFCEKGDIERALADYTEAIRLEPRNAANYVMRAQCYLLHGQRDKALADYTDAVRLNPQYAPLLEEVLDSAPDPNRGKSDGH